MPVEIEHEVFERPALHESALAILVSPDNLPNRCRFPAPCMRLLGLPQLRSRHRGELPCIDLSVRWSRPSPSRAPSPRSRCSSAHRGYPLKPRPQKSVKGSVSSTTNPPAAMAGHAEPVTPVMTARSALKKLASAFS